MALIATTASEHWEAAIARDAALLHCANPKCVHLFKHVRKGEALTFERLECEATIAVVVHDKEQLRFRFGPEDHIHLGCRGTVCQQTNQRQVAPGHMICGDCHAARAHMGIGGECRACAEEALPQPEKRATRGELAANPPVTEADSSGPRLVAIEQINLNSYKNGQTLEEIKTEEADVKRGREVDGGTAQRKAEAQRRRSVANEARTQAKTTKTKLQAAIAKLEELEAGSTIGADEDADEEVDTADEDREAASKFFMDNDQSVAALREAFPLCALMWYGEEPTPEQIEEQKQLVAVLKASAKAQKDAFALVLQEAQQAEDQLKADGIPLDYEDALPDAGDADPNAPPLPEGEEDDEEEADKRAKPKRGGKKAKKPVEEMNEEELAQHNEQKAEEARKRRELTAKKRKMCDEHPGLVKKAEKYQKAKELLVEHRQVIADQNERLVAKHQEYVDEKERRVSLRQRILAWIGDDQDKPADWNGEAMEKAFRAFVSAQAAAAGGAKKRKREAEAEAEAQPEAADDH